MRDGTGRDIHYLRLSVTDRCNLRCAYCMPTDGVEQLSHADILTFEETQRLVRLMTELGVRRVKITGGEPLVRIGTVDLIRRIKELPGIEQVTLTTNGVFLPRYLEDLADAGIDGINISLDTLNRETYRQLTGIDGLENVLDAIESATRAIRPVKLNVVPVKGLNDGELCDLASMANRQVAAVRFIELMPVGRAGKFERIDAQEIRVALESCFGTMEACAGRIGNGPAEYFRPPGFSGRIGFIHAMSDAFCDSCNRVRLTADGRFMPCLGRADHVDMKRLLRGGASDGELLDVLRQGIFAKPERHGFLDDADLSRRDMNAIGG
jgi:cyclic pyranopterin phosphate synthase